MKSLAIFLTLLALALGHGEDAATRVSIAAAPAGEPLSSDYVVRVQGQLLPVYECKVAPADKTGRWKAMDDKANSANYFEKASFGYFDASGTVKIEVTCPHVVTSAKVLPSSYRIPPQVQDHRVTFEIPGPFPRHATLEINGTWTRALHLFVNPPESNPPDPRAPGTLYYGPGIHEVTSVVVTNNQTVYIAPGAIVRGVIGEKEPFSISSYSGLKNYAPTFLLKGTNITFRGRGILDGGFATTHARHLVQVQGQGIRLEGVILRDSSTWTVPIRRSDNIRVNNLKLLGYRANSDGIDICNSRDVTVSDCFIRTLDDLIVIKTDQGQGKSQRIRAENCVLWNELAHALSVGAELREDVDDVVFRNCDVIHDFGREWSLRVYHCDAARVSNVRFEDLRIEESPRLISLWIDKAVWSRDAERGHISGVRFENIAARTETPRVELKGFDATHQIENVEFKNVTVNGRSLSAAEVKTNAFVRGVSVQP